jgi:hypothetical protein
MDHYIERVVDLLDPSLNRIGNMTVEEARRRVLSGNGDAVREIDGSFALLAREGKTVRMARSLDRPMRYFLAKRAEGPALIVGDRIDAIHHQLEVEGLQEQFHPSYTRMVPAHYVVEIQLVGCPDPDPTYTRYFTPERGSLPADLDEIGRRYIGALADEIAKWLTYVEQSPWPGVSAFGSPHPGPTALELRSADFSPPPSGSARSAGSGMNSALQVYRNSLNSTAVGSGGRHELGNLIGGRTRPKRMPCQGLIDVIGFSIGWQIVLSWGRIFFDFAGGGYSVPVTQSRRF